MADEDAIVKAMLADKQLMRSLGVYLRHRDKIFLKVWPQGLIHTTSDPEEYIRHNISAHVAVDNSVRSMMNQSSMQSGRKKKGPLE